eukprot:TRINITY_DN23425_c0_g1_i1.p1 TRINITY_DN23425_c0_g1~~TRINITY_DN23425_c0_g1_i1.p1  ORF type:complete len:425 (-),score=53.74 TRINITY_DN23425_c0_g1_i1:183-1457(-)
MGRGGRPASVFNFSNSAPKAVLTASAITVLGFPALTAAKRVERRPPLWHVAAAASTLLGVAARRHVSAGDAGFVACVHNGDAAQLWAALEILRVLGNVDPVCVFYVGDGELRLAWRRKFQAAVDVVVRDLLAALEEGVLDAMGGVADQLRGFSCKVMALVHSPFRRTLLMDPDVVFFKNPATLWSHPDVLRTGTMFFFDRVLPHGPGRTTCEDIIDFAADPTVIHELAPSLRADFASFHERFCDGNTSHEQCSSVVAVDRSHPIAARAMAMLLRLYTGYRLRWHSLRWWGFGDKEFYWLACELAGVQCTFNPRGRPRHALATTRQPPRPAVWWPSSCLVRPVDCGCVAQPDPDPTASMHDIIYLHLSNNCGGWSRVGLATVTLSSFAMRPRNARSRRGATRTFSPGENATFQEYRHAVASGEGV